MSRDNGVKKEDSKTTREKAVARMKQRIADDAKWTEGHPPPQKGMSNLSDFRKVLLWTGVPLLVMSIAST